MEETEQKDNGTITIKKDSLWKYSTFILLAIVILGGFSLFSGSGSPGPTGNVVANPGAPTPTVVDVSEDDDAVLGDANAPVTIIEFSDYECPFCGRFWSQTYPLIKSQYVDTGKVKLIFRDFPLSFHPSAQKAAEAAECVGKNGDDAYYQMHDKIFENQASGLSVAKLKQWAQELGYNIDSCLDSGEMTSEVQADFRDGQASGVRGTPGFFVNGKSISGAQPFDVFKQVIDAELA